MPLKSTAKADPVKNSDSKYPRLMRLITDYAQTKIIWLQSGEEIGTILRAGSDHLNFPVGLVYHGLHEEGLVPYTGTITLENA